jgi:hypothetical protein
MQPKNTALVPLGPEGRTFHFQHKRPELPPRFRGLSGQHMALVKWLRLRYPSLSQDARAALGEAATAHWLDWTLDPLTQDLEPFVPALLALPRDGTSPAVLRETATTLQLQMRWRRVREDRLDEVRGDVGYFLDRAFVAWLLKQPVPLLASWASQYLGRAPRPRRDAAFRLSRLRPMPLPILWAWTVFQHERAVETWRPSDDELQIHGVVSAVAQWLEWWASHRRRYSWPIEQVDLAPAARTVALALEGTSTGRLTIPQAVFERARNLALRSLEPPEPPARPTENLGTPADGTVRLHLVRTPSPEVVTHSPSAYQALRCFICQQAGDTASEVNEFPPYRTACTCQLVLDWEQEPLAEAPYDWALFRWAESRPLNVHYPFPTTRLLFKLNEEHLGGRPDCSQ